MEPPRPPVTITDPARQGLPPPEPPAQRPTSPGSRRWPTVVVAALVAGAAALVVSDRLEQRRLGRTVDVSVDRQERVFVSSAHAPQTRTTTLRVTLRLRNDGPQAVRITSARLGALRGSATTRLAAGGSGDLHLVSTVRCPADGRPPADEDAAPLVLEVRTSAGSREVTLSRGQLPADASGSARQACGFLPLRQAVRVSGKVTATGDGRARVRVVLATSAQRAPLLTSLSFARGLEVVAIDGRPAGLPLRLPQPAPGATAGLPLDLQLVLNCGAILATGNLPLGDVDALVENPQDDEIGQITGRLAGVYELAQLVAETCAPGSLAS